MVNRGPFGSNEIRNVFSRWSWRSRHINRVPLKPYWISPSSIRRSIFAGLRYSKEKILRSSRKRHVVNRLRAGWGIVASGILGVRIRDGLFSNCPLKDFDTIGGVWLVVILDGILYIQVRPRSWQRLYHVSTKMALDHEDDAQILVFSRIHMPSSDCLQNLRFGQRVRDHSRPAVRYETPSAIMIVLVSGRSELKSKAQVIQISAFKVGIRAMSQGVRKSRPIEQLNQAGLFAYFANPPLLAPEVVSTIFYALLT